ncbi:MAG: alpha/beta hydrolase-fold protein [Bacteroidota bacterium]
MTRFTNYTYFSLTLLLHFLMSCTTPPPPPPPSVLAVSSGHVERIDSFVSMHVTARDVDIWLPDTYDGKIPHQVLYMHDGQMLYDSTTTWNGQEWGVDEVLGQLIAEGKVPPTIVVGVYNGGPTRHPDYFPQQPFDALPDSMRQHWLTEAKKQGGISEAETSVRSDAYLRFLFEELKPVIDERYRVHTDAAQTFMAGSSMGGLISMYALGEYPKYLAGAACLSTHWIGLMQAGDDTIPLAFADYVREKILPSEEHRIYFDYGTETLDAHYEPHQLRVDSILRAKGYGADQWRSEKFPGAAHTEDAWRERLHIPLEWLLNTRLGHPK